MRCERGQEAHRAERQARGEQATSPLADREVDAAAADVDDEQPSGRTWRRDSLRSSSPPAPTEARKRSIVVAPMSRMEMSMSMSFARRMLRDGVVKASAR